MADIELEVNGPVTNDELNALFHACWDDHVDEDYSHVLETSLAYVCARLEGRLVGYVYLAWDGGGHAFLLDPTVHPELRRRGLGLGLVDRARKVAEDEGCKWLHVDYLADLEPFYKAAGFRPTKAGLIRLRQ